jgi:glycosyltransferase involved in cell wall biosynthesis
MKSPPKKTKFNMPSKVSSTPLQKTVLWIDTNFSYSDPTTRHLLYALPRLQAAGWRVKIWCLESEAPRDSVEHVFMPFFRSLGPVNWFFFSLLANGYGLWRRLIGKPRPAEIIHATCAAYFGANLVSVHFLNCVWLRKQLGLGFSTLKEFIAFVIYALGGVMERLHWWSPALKLVLPVSDSVGDDVRRRARRSVAIETMPNSYDETRFNPTVREERRAPFREKLGFQPGDAVFIFTSLGHYKRKGFWLAIDALRHLRTDPAMSHVRFLIVGGQPATLARLQARLDHLAPDWKAWITFTGQQKDVESYIAAADAFLFPSYFEAFSLAEIEAAAMGVPLLLTRHHGSEMILEEGVNGLWLEFDPDAIAETIRGFLQMGPSAFHRSIGKALTRAEYAERLLAIYEAALARTAPTPDPH